MGTGVTKELTAKQCVFATEYLKDYNGTRAAREAGVPKNAASSVAGAWLHDPRFVHVAAYIEREIYHKNLRAKKSADEVLEYLQIAMYFVPSKYFQPGDRGGWLIDEENYKKLPDEIGRIIEEVEVRSKQVSRPDGTEVTLTRFWVKFVNKTKVTQMVAKFMLGSKVLVQPDESFFDQMMSRAKTVEADRIEDKIQQKLLPGPGTNGAVK